MPSHPIRSLLGLLVAAAVAAGVLAAPAAAHPHGPSDDEFTFIGGGWGHGSGMSQYGALGRAEAGHTYQEILSFYYDSTTLTTDPGLVPDDVDVRIAVHNTTVFRPSGLLTVSMDGQFLDTTVNTLTVRRGNGGWHINSSNIDWCRGFCSGTVLTVSFNDGEVVRVSNTSNGAERYAHGQFQLTPATSGIANCGSAGANQYCLVVGELTMQQYLYGLDEVPHSWPAEALKAQAVAARSYAVAIMADRADWSAPFDLYATTRDQEYRAWDFEMEPGHDRWTDEVDATDDTVLTHPPAGGGGPGVIVAYYSSSNGGHTAANEEPRRDPVPYLLAKPDPFDAAPDANNNPQNATHSWERTYTADQISEWLAAYPFADLDVGEITEIYIGAGGPSGRIDDSLVTLVGSDRTLEVRDEDGEPYGYRFYYALVLGCRNTPGCRPVLSTKLTLQGSHTGNGHTVHNLPFTDVRWDDPYAEAVLWLLETEITQGTTATTFSPERSVTRAQFATFLWRFAGEPPSADGSLAFDDVEPDSYYSRAVGWMVDQSITQGCSGDSRLFCPDDRLGAAQMAAFMWRFAGRTYSNHPVPFTDIGINDYYLEAARWLVEHRLWVGADFQPPGDGPAEFNPGSDADRAHMALLLWNLAAAPAAFDIDVPLPPLMRSP
ncbi:MAG: SpoIID/LytB domain-containing protein [Acidimicrobiaceae bacterium]|nr:SpoIID/LytB domain-containing protein [Acidimicrobiaceae bacterium]